MIPGKIGQSEPRFAPNGCRKKCRAAPRGQKSDFRGAYLDRRFHISRGFPTTTPACILCGNYPIRPGRPQVSCPPSTRFWKWAHKITHGARSAALTHDYKSVLRLQPKNVLSSYHREEEEDFVPLPWQVISAVPQRTGISSALPANRDGRRVRALRGGDQQAG